MYSNFKVLAFTVVLGLLSGCASVEKMPLSKTASSADIAQKSIVVGRLVVENKHKFNHQPKLIAVGIKKQDKVFSFTEPTLVAEEPNLSKDYIFSLSSEPGMAELSFMRFMRKAFPIVGTAEFIVGQEIEFPQSGIVYIGNINAVIETRKEGEPRAGSLIPLIDQSITGFSSGTFKINITDNYDEDMAVLKEQFPYLADQPISKAILSE